MEGKGIESEPHRLTKKHFTKEQRKVIGELTSEWGLLDSADHLISKLVFKQYQALRPGMKRPPELVELEREQDVISKRKREISAELNELEEGIHPRRRRPGRRSDPYVLVRNGLIRASRHRRDKDIAQRATLAKEKHDLIEKESRAGQPQGQGGRGRGGRGPGSADGAQNNNDGGRQ